MPATVDVYGIYLMSEDTDFLYSTDIIDFGLTGIKTVEGVDLLASFSDKTIVEVMVAWRNNKREDFRDTKWVRVSPEGSCSPIVSGVEFKVSVRMIPCTDVSLDMITIRWKLVDKRHVRGLYQTTGQGGAT